MRALERRRNRRPGYRRVLAAALLAALAAMPAVAADDLLARFESRTTVHVLDNGWTFLIVERPVAPVFSFATVVDVGSVREVPGITGLAHMFEHMAFKGTPTIGTTDYEAERRALAAVEAAYEAYERARRDPGARPERVEELREAFRARQEAAARYAFSSEFSNLVERNGGVHLNASTGADLTTYLYSLPANRFELFAWLESERFLRPVFRDFYRERDVVQEERRLAVESRPAGRLFEQLAATAFVAHPYKQPVVGYMSDLQSFTASDAETFFRRYYAPSNLVTAIVGQLRAEEVIPLLERYFGRLPAGEKPRPLRTVEPPQIGEKTVTLRDPAQPLYAEVYHKPSVLDGDEAAYQAIDDVLSNGRTSRLYRSLVSDRKIAAVASSFSNFPGRKYPSLWMVWAVPARGHGNDEVQTAIRAELERLRSEPITTAELERFRARAKADLVRRLGSNLGLARQLATYHTLHGDWRELFRQLERIEAVTREDIQRVARATFVPSNRTVGRIETEPPATEPAVAGPANEESRR